jgi:hypothetical protein
MAKGTGGPSAKYRQRAEQFAMAIDIAAELVADTPTAAISVEFGRMVKAMALGTGTGAALMTRRTMAALHQLEEDFLTSWYEGSGPNADLFWQRIAEHDLPYARRDVLAGLIARGRIKTPYEHEVAVDSILVAQQEGRITEEQAEALGEMILRYEKRQAGESVPRAPVAVPRRRPGPRQSFEPGVVLRVGIDDAWHTYARMLAISPYIAFHDCRINEPLTDLHAAIATPVLFVLAVHKDAYRTGHWPAVGHVRVDERPTAVPDHFLHLSQYEPLGPIILDPHGRQRRGTVEECVDLEVASVYDAEHVEERLADHYAGRPNVMVEYYRIKLPLKPPGHEHGVEG